MIHVSFFHKEIKLSAICCLIYCILLSSGTTTITERKETLVGREFCGILMIWSLFARAQLRKKRILCRFSNMLIRDFIAENVTIICISQRILTKIISVKKKKKKKTRTEYGRRNEFLEII